MTGERGTITGRVDVEDGDDLWFGPVRVRLRGIDAPKKSAKCNGSDRDKWECGKAAIDKLRELIKDSHVRCQQVDFDQKRNRPVARCCVGEIDLGRELVRLGLAWVYRHYEDCYEAEEDAARQANHGIWNAPNVAPWESRKLSGRSEHKRRTPILSCPKQPFCAF